MRCTILLGQINYMSSLILPSLCFISVGLRVQANKRNRMKRRAFTLKKTAGSGAPLKTTVFSGIGNSFCLPAFLTKSSVQPQSEYFQKHLIMLFPVKTPFHEASRKVTIKQNQLLFPQISKNGEMTIWNANESIRFKMPPALIYYM